MFSPRALRARPGASVRVAAALLLALAAGAIALRAAHIVGEFRANPADAFSDFNYYFYAFDCVLHHRHDPSCLYDHGGLVAFLQRIGARHDGYDVFYGYPPQFALLFAPLALLTPLAAKIVWLCASVALFAAGALLVAKTTYRGDERGVAVLLVALALLNRPALEDAYWGQSNELLFFLLAATLFLIERRYRYAAGVFLAFAVVLKVTPIAVAGLLLLRREWRTLAATAAVSLAVTLITASQLGWRVLWHYLVSDMPRLNAQNLLLGGAPMNNAFRGALQTLAAGLGIPLPGAALAAVSAVFAAAICVLSAGLVLRRHEDRRIDFALACITMLVASPMLEPIHLTVALIPLMILFGTAFEVRARPRGALGPGVERLLGALAALILFAAARSVSYTVAALILYGLCVARYFPLDERAGNASTQGADRKR
jgi:hypothetical protein